MIPLFKTHYSIGKSILTLDDSDGSLGDLHSDSVFEIIKENNLNKLVLVEDSMGGFLEAHKKSKALGIQLVFGLRLSVCEDGEGSHKIIIFMKNGEAYKDLVKIYTQAFTENSNCITPNELKELWNKKNLKLAVPFYDSFLHSNYVSFDVCIPDLSSLSPTFFIESNNLPIDNLLKERVREYCKSNNFSTQDVKSIYYKNKKDFDAYLTYKLICSREFKGGRAPTLEVPNFDHMSSDDFCWESYLKNESS